MHRLPVTVQMRLAEPPPPMVGPTALALRACVKLGVTSEHNGPHTPLPVPQQLVAAQPKPGGHCALEVHARSPAQGVLPGMHAPAPSGVLKHKQSGCVAEQRGRLPQELPAQVWQVWVPQQSQDSR